MRNIMGWPKSSFGFPIPSYKMPERNFCPAQYMDNTNLFFFFFLKKTVSSSGSSIFHCTFKQACFSVLLFSVLLSPCPAPRWLGAAPQTGTSQVRAGAGASFPDCDGLPSIFDVLRLAGPSSSLLPSQGTLPVSARSLPSVHICYVCVLLLLRL